MLKTVIRKSGFEYAQIQDGVVSLRDGRTVRKIENRILPFYVEAKSILQTYPPPRPNQRYRRTGRLGRGWAIKKYRTHNYLSLWLENNVWYRPLVQGPNTLPIHLQTGWPQYEPVVSDYTDEIEMEIDLIADEDFR